MTPTPATRPAPDPTAPGGRVDGARVEARHVTKRYGAALALEDVSVTIEPGTIHALVGENGAGKSTLGKVIAGAVAPNTGEIVVDGEPVRYRSPRDAIRHGIAIIDQELAMVHTLSVLDNVFLGSELGAHGVLDRSAQREVYKGLAAKLALTADPDTRVSRLRVADQQKIEIMRALVRNARLIVMDEPTAALTREEAQRLLDITRELAATGVTIVYVSHFLGDVLALCDTITVLKDGKHVHTVAAADETQDSLVTAMIGRSLDLQFPPKSPPADGRAGGAHRHAGSPAHRHSTRSRSTSAPARSSASPGWWAAVAVRSRAPSSAPIRRRERSRSTAESCGHTRRVAASGAGWRCCPRAARTRAW